MDVDVPDRATITEVSVAANGVFTGHCPNPPYNQDCNLSGTFISPSTDEGTHVIALEGWEFDSDDSVTGTVTVKYNDENGNPQSFTIPNGQITWI